MVDGCKNVMCVCVGEVQGGWQDQMRKEFVWKGSRILKSEEMD